MKMMKTLTAMAAAMVAMPAMAHEVWVERDATGPARIYLGEPNEAVPEAGDPEFHHLQKPQVLAAGGGAVALTRRTNHIEAAVPGNGDVRLRDETVFDPWKEGDKQAGAVFYARAGRTEPTAALDLELVPTAANSDTVVLMFKGKPVPDASVNVITPDKWEKRFKTDANGTLTLPNQGAGRYIVGASHEVEGPAKLNGKDVAKLSHISTLTFVR